jgi:hypothetical protein
MFRSIFKGIPALKRKVADDKRLKKWSDSKGVPIPFFIRSISATAPQF